MLINNKIGYIFTTFDSPLLKKKSFLKNLKLNFFSDKGISKKTSEEEYFFSFMKNLKKFLHRPIFTFILNNENKDSFIHEIESADIDLFYIFSTYPQVNSKSFQISNFFQKNLKIETIEKFFWVKSYFSSPFFIESIVKKLRKKISEDKIDEKKIKIIFLAEEDSKNPLYTFECQITSQKVVKYFPYIEGELFLYTKKNFKSFIEKQSKENIYFISISNIINDNLIIDNLKNYKHYLFNSLTEDTFFVRSIVDIIEEKNFITNDMLNNF